MSTPPILAPNCYSWSLAPPSRDTIFSTLDDTRTPRVEYKSPFYSMPKDVPPRAREYAGRSFRLLGDTIKFIPTFVHWTGYGISDKLNVNQQWGRASRIAWEYGQLPPSRTEVGSWLDQDRIASAVKPHSLGSQVCNLQFRTMAHGLSTFLTCNRSRDLLRRIKASNLYPSKASLLLEKLNTSQSSLLSCTVNSFEFHD